MNELRRLSIVFMPAEVDPTLPGRDVAAREYFTNKITVLTHKKQIHHGHDYLTQ